MTDMGLLRTRRVPIYIVKTKTECKKFKMSKNTDKHTIKVYSVTFFSKKKYIWILVQVPFEVETIPNVDVQWLIKAIVGDF